VNLEQVVAGEQKTYPDERKKNGDGAKDGLGGEKLEIFTGFRASMASFKAEMASSRPLGLWDSIASMVEV